MKKWSQEWEDSIRKSLSKMKKEQLIELYLQKAYEFDLVTINNEKPRYITDAYKGEPIELIKPGMIVEFRDGTFGIAVGKFTICVDWDQKSWRGKFVNLHLYNTDLTTRNRSNPNMDIVKIHVIGGGIRSQVWKAKAKLTEKEKTLLSLIPYEFSWIARNDNGNLNVFLNKPIKQGNAWSDPGNNLEARNLKIFNDYFPFICFSDDEPYDLEVLRDQAEEKI